VRRKCVRAGPWLRTGTPLVLTDTHPAPNSNVTVSPGTAGTYGIGPILFDAPGTWTVRFHLFATCSDLAVDSPAGQVAFYVDVP